MSESFFFLIATGVRGNLFKCKCSKKKKKRKTEKKENKTFHREDTVP